MSRSRSIPDDQFVPEWDHMERAVHEHTRRVRAAVDQACELALQTGVCGVLVTYHPMEVRPESNGYGIGATVELSMDVPYGTIAERHEGLEFGP
jgi:hypothetical protein